MATEHTIDKLTPFQKLLCSVPGASVTQLAACPMAEWKTAQSSIVIFFCNVRHQEIFIRTEGIHDFFPMTDNTMSELDHLEAWRTAFNDHRQWVTDFHAIVILTAILAIEPPTPPPHENDC